MENTKNTNWEKEFRRLFVGDCETPWGYEPISITCDTEEEVNELISFISSLLEQEKIKWLEEVEKSLPKEREITEEDDTNDRLYDSKCYFNNCLKEVKDCLQTIKQQLTK